MASLDAARAAAAAPGAFDMALAAAAAARDAAGQLPGLQVLSAKGDGAEDLPTMDPLKLTLGVAGLGISGLARSWWCCLLAAICTIFSSIYLLDTC